MNAASPSIVRRALPQDFDGIWQLFRLLHAENALFSMSERKLNWLLERVLHPELIPEWDTGLRGFMGVIGAPGSQLEGFILMVVGSFWYSEDLTLEEYANFVHPDYRKSDHAKTLLAYARNVSDQIKIPLVIGIISNIRTQAKVRLYRRQLPEKGSFFVYDPNEPSLRMTH